jgi:hypothetical protein
VVPTRLAPTTFTMDVRDPGGTAASWWDLDKVRSLSRDQELSTIPMFCKGPEPPVIEVPARRLTARPAIRARSSAP